MYDNNARIKREIIKAKTLIIKKKNLLKKHRHFRILFG